MRKASSIQITLLVLVVVVCVATGIYSYVCLAGDDGREFNLYSLVPQDATAVVETDRMDELVDEVDNLHCSRDGHFLYVSDLFVYLKNYIYALVDDAPHGLSKQMNKMLLSFHTPDSPENQVMYCSLGTGDTEMMAAFISKYASGKYPPKSTRYRGETIHVYPVPDGRFLSAFYTSRFLAVSFRKQLIEQVIDAYRDDRSLLQLPTFKAMQAGRRPGVSATVYVRMKSVDMGMTPEPAMTPVLPLGDWAEFDLRFDGDGIYCSGVSHEADSVSTFVSLLSQRDPIQGFPGPRLPATTFFHVHSPLLDAESLPWFLPFTSPNGETADEHIARWVEFIAEHGRGEMLSCLFTEGEGKHRRICAALLLDVADPALTERRLKEMAKQRPRVAMPAWQFHHGRLLLAPDEQSLKAYVSAIDAGRTLEETPAYHDGTASLASGYSFLMMADMEEITRPELEGSVRALPGFFLRQARFFRHFMLSAQFTAVEGMVYPNLILTYKGH